VLKKKQRRLRVSDIDSDLIFNNTKNFHYKKLQKKRQYLRNISKKTSKKEIKSQKI